MEWTYEAWNSEQITTSVNQKSKLFSLELWKKRIKKEDSTVTSYTAIFVNAVERKIFSTGTWNNGCGSPTKNN